MTDTYEVGPLGFGGTVGGDGAGEAWSYVVTLNKQPFVEVSIYSVDMRERGHEDEFEDDDDPECFDFEIQTTVGDPENPEEINYDHVGVRWHNEAWAQENEKGAAKDERDMTLYVLGLTFPDAEIIDKKD